MCGIVWGRSLLPNKPVNNRIWQLYKEQSSRGKEGFGFVTFNSEGIKVCRDEHEDGIKTKLLKENASEVLFHHRYPTSTPNLKDATHPIKVSHKDFDFDYYVVHNGVITNDKMLKDKHEKLGFVYTTTIIEKLITVTHEEETVYFNDSECLAIEIALHIEDRQEFSSAYGSASAIILQVNKKTQKPIALYYGRNGGNPLKAHRTKKMLTISSEHPKGEMVPVNHLYRLDYKTDEITAEVFKIAQYDYAVGYGGYGGYGASDYYSSDAGYGVRDAEEYGDDYTCTTPKDRKPIPNPFADEKVDDFSDIEESLYNDEDYISLAEEEWNLERQIKQAVIDFDYDAQKDFEADLADIQEEKREYEKYYQHLNESDFIGRIITMFTVSFAY